MNAAAPPRASGVQQCTDVEAREWRRPRPPSARPPSPGPRGARRRARAPRAGRAPRRSAARRAGTARDRPPCPARCGPVPGRPMQAAEPSVAQRSASRWPTRCHAVALPLQQERRAHLLHQIGGVVGGGAIDAEPDAHARRLHVADRAMAGGENLVAARAMRDRDAGLRQPRDLRRIEMDAVREPHAVMQPAHIVEVVERPAAEARLAERGLVLGLGEMRVQPHAAFARPARRWRASATW